MFFSIKYSLPFLAGQKKRYLLGFIMAAVENVLAAVPSLIIGRIVDQLIQNRIDMPKMWFYLALILIATLISYGAAYIWTVAVYGSRSLGQKYFQDRFMAHCMQKRQVFYEKFSSGDLMSRATMDVDHLVDLVSWGMSILFYSGSKIVIYFILMLATGGLSLSLFSLSPFLLLAILSHLREKELEKRWNIRQKAFAEVNDRVLEGVEGVQTIRAFAQEDTFESDFRRSTAKLTRLSNRISQLGYSYAMTAQLANVLVFLITVWLGIRKVEAGSLSIGTLLSFQIYVTNLANPITNIGQNLNILQNANVSAKRIQEVMGAGDDMEEGGTKLTKIENVHLEGYSFTYPGDEKPGLTDLRLNLAKGRILGLVGKTGSGKSTFLRQFLRQFPAGSGCFEINGIPLKRIQAEGTCIPIAYVSQNHAFYSGTIRENVAFSIDSASDEDILDAMALANFFPDREGMPDGLDTQIGEKGVSLSGGQKQRLSMARAFIKNPDFLILDDSLSAVDAHTEAKILDNIRRTRKDKTTLISSHRLSAIEHAEEILVFDEGRIIDRGSHKDLMGRTGWYRDQHLHQYRISDRKADAENPTCDRTEKADRLIREGALR